jgi:hypothetical protein
VQAAHGAGVPVVAGGRAFGTTPRRAFAIGADSWTADPGTLADVRPVLAQRPTVVPDEAVLLDAVDDTTVSVAFDRLLAAFPGLQDTRPCQQSRVRENLRWMARFAGAAVVTRDASVLDDVLNWLARLPHGRVPAGLLAASGHAVADAVEPLAATGALLLRGAADRLPAREPV